MPGSDDIQAAPSLSGTSLQRRMGSEGGWEAKEDGKRRRMGSEGGWEAKNAFEGLQMRSDISYGLLGSSDV